MQSASRSILRASRQARTFKPQHFRFESTNAGPHATSGSSSALVGAASGAAAAVVIGYGAYHFSGARDVVNTAQSTKEYINTAQQKFKSQVQEKAPNPNEALRWLRQVSTYYAGFVPGASGFVNTTFDDLEKIRGKHGEEVDKIISEAYNELKGLTSKEMNLQTAQQAWEIIEKHTSRIADLAGDAMEDILDNHPTLKEKVGGPLKQLKQMGDNYGQDAKEQFEKTWTEIRDATKNGINVEKIQKIVQDKIEQVQKLGDEAWKKGFEQAKPLLDKSPKIKELVEKNSDALKKGNVAEVFKKVKTAAESGKTEDLEAYIKSAKKQAQQAVGNWDQYLKMIPGGDELGSKLQQLSEIASAKGPEAKSLLEDTMKDVQSILDKRSAEAKNLAKEAKDDTKQ